MRDLGKNIRVIRYEWISAGIRAAGRLKYLICCLTRKLAVARGLVRSYFNLKTLYSSRVYSIASYIMDFESCASRFYCSGVCSPVSITDGYRVIRYVEPGYDGCTRTHDITAASYIQRT